MKKLIQEIRQQPAHIRHFFMWTSVAVVFFVVGYVGLSVIAHDVSDIVQGESAQVRNQDSVAGESDESPFALIGNAIGELPALISGVFSGNDDAEAPRLSSFQDPVPPQRLPIE